MNILQLTAVTAAAATAVVAFSALGNHATGTSAPHPGSVSASADDSGWGGSVIAGAGESVAADTATGS